MGSVQNRHQLDSSRHCLTDLDYHGKASASRTHIHRSNSCKLLCLLELVSPLSTEQASPSKLAEVQRQQKEQMTPRTSSKDSL